MKKKKKNNNKKGIVIFGIRISSDNLIATIIAMFGFILIGIKEYQLKNHDTEIVAAEILDVGIRRRGGVGVKPKIGYIKFRYFIKEKEVIHFTSSSYIRDNIEQYRIGDCIEVLVSLENKNVWKWNKEKGSFKCD